MHPRLHADLEKKLFNDFMSTSLSYRSQIDNAKADFRCFDIYNAGRTGSNREMGFSQLYLFAEAAASKRTDRSGRQSLCRMRVGGQHFAISPHLTAVSVCFRVIFPHLSVFSSDFHTATSTFCCLLKNPGYRKYQRLKRRTSL